MKKVVIAQSQTIYDIAIQEYGSVDAVFSLAADNPTVVTNLNDALAPGTTVYIKTPATDPKVLKFFTDNKIQPATGQNVVRVPLVNADGITPLLNIDGTPLFNIY